MVAPSNPCCAELAGALGEWIYVRPWIVDDPDELGNRLTSPSAFTSLPCERGRSAGMSDALGSRSCHLRMRAPLVCAGRGQNLLRKRPPRWRGCMCLKSWNFQCRSSSACLAPGLAIPSERLGAFSSALAYSLVAAGDCWRSANAAARSLGPAARESILGLTASLCGALSSPGFGLWAG